MFNKIRYLLKLNMMLFLENELLKDGNFTNVTSGLQFYDGSDMSRFLVDNTPRILAEIGLQDPTTGALSTGRVYQSPFKNFVYESGISLNPSVQGVGIPLPIRMSGVYVDGAFYPTDPNAVGYNANFAHTIDYINGRVIFNNALPANSVVNADFAYKHVTVVTASRFNNQLIDGVLETKFTTNPRTANQLIYPSGNTHIMPYPIIFIEDVSRDYRAYQLGDRSLITRDEMVYHIYALDESTRDNLIDLVAFQENKRVPIIDFNSAPFPLSGILNTLNPEYISYQTLVRDNVIVATKTVTVDACSPSGVVTTDIVRHQNAVGFLADIQNTNVLDLDQFKQDTNAEIFERAIVGHTAEVYTIAPTSPFGFQLSPIFPSGG